MADNFKEIKTLTFRNTALTNTDAILVRSNTGAVNWMLTTAIKDFMSAGTPTADVVTISSNSQPYVASTTGSAIVDDILITSPAATSFSIGTTPNGDEVFFPTPVAANTPLVVSIKYPVAQNQVLYLNGLPSGATAKIYKK